MGFVDKLKESFELGSIVIEAGGVALLVLYGGIGWAYEAYATYQRSYPLTKGPVSDFVRLPNISINTSMVMNGFINFFLISVLTWIGAPISGGHFNPAITIGHIVTGNIELFKGIVYIIAQLVGSVGGTLLYGLIVPGFLKSVAEYANVTAGLPSIHSAFGYQNFVIQFFGAFGLMFVFYALRIEKKGGSNQSFAVAIGAITAATVMCFGEFTYHPPGMPKQNQDKLHGVTCNSNLNPARVFGPALFNFSKIRLTSFMYGFFGPILGAVVASLVYKWFLHKKEVEEDEEDEVIAD